MNNNSTSKSTQQAVVCLSGGMDSTGLLLHLLARGFRVSGISFDYGQKHKLELQRLKQNLEYLTTKGYEVSHHQIDLSLLGNIFHSALTNPDQSVPLGHYEQSNMRATVVPNRNAIFASIAYGYALSIATSTREPIKLCLGVHSGDHEIYPDCRPEFYSALHHAFSIGNWESELVSLYLPYLDGDKFTILQDTLASADTLQLDFDTLLRNTCTSYLPDERGRSHGETGSDVERILAFHRLGRIDPVAYAQPWADVLRRALELEQAAAENSE
jgi:7-cyano-7-deazaguanine synthase